MKLTTEQITSCAWGAVRTEETDTGVRLHRFTKEQEEMYRNYSSDFYRKSLSPAGIRLVFRTDSLRLFLKVFVEPGSSRKYFALEVFADGKPVGCLDNFTEQPMPREYTIADFPLGEHQRSVALPEGEKTVEVTLPWSMITELREVSLEEGASFAPVKSQGKMLIYGDSITQGYDALYPSQSYASRLADAIGLEAVNKGIGGERFQPALGALKDEISPKYITVAYGTNDWSGATAEETEEKCKAFYLSIRKNYPGVKIFAITPIWRKDQTDPRPMGEFSTIHEIIRRCVCDLPDVICIDGENLVPPDPELFGDFRLHPNDDGFALYSENLYRKLKPYL